MNFLRRSAPVPEDEDASPAADDLDVADDQGAAALVDACDSIPNLLRPVCVWRCSRGPAFRGSG